MEEVRTAEGEGEGDSETGEGTECEGEGRGVTVKYIHVCFQQTCSCVVREMIAGVSVSLCV